MNPNFRYGFIFIFFFIIYNCIMNSENLILKINNNEMLLGFNWNIGIMYGSMNFLFFIRR